MSQQDFPAQMDAVETTPLSSRTMTIRPDQRQSPRLTNVPNPPSQRFEPLDTLINEPALPLVEYQASNLVSLPSFPKEYTLN